MARLDGVGVRDLADRTIESEIESVLEAGYVIVLTITVKCGKMR